MSLFHHTDLGASVSTDAGSRPAISGPNGPAANATGHRAPTRLVLVEPDPFDGAAAGEAALDCVVIALLACQVTELRRTLARQESRLRALESAS